MFQWLFQNMVSFVDLVTEHIKCKDEPEMGICSKGNFKKIFLEAVKGLQIVFAFLLRKNILEEPVTRYYVKYTYYRQFP